MSKFVSFIIMIILVLSNQLNSYAAENKEINIKSEAAVVLDSDTGAVIYAKNPEEKLYPASLTKIATAIYAIEKGNLEDTVTVSRNAASQAGTRVYLDEGEKVTLKKLIQGMLINSGNDAAVAIAEHIDGSVEKFSENINAYLKKTVGVNNTHFTNPNGLFDANHFTTAMDLAKITNYAKKNPVFSEIFGTRELSWSGESWKTTLITHHLMLKGEIPYPGITGGKTGFVEESKSTLATTADNGKIKLTAIALKAANKKVIYQDTKQLLDYSFNNFQHTVINQNDIFKQGKKEFFSQSDTVLTEPVNGAMKKVNDHGILFVKNKDGQILQQTQLKYKEPKKVYQPQKQAIDKMNFHFNAFYGIIIFAFAGIFIGIRKRFQRKY
ncbi:MAG: D-alanyl-D-alanine carboxypeptidase family protein [Neobacillus sp.]